MQDGVVYTASNTGVFLSTNRGNQWVARNEGLTYHDIRSIESFGGFLFIGTSTQGIWKRSLAEMKPVGADDIDTPMDIHLDQNFPNPVRIGTEALAAFSLPNRCHVSVRLYNHLGKEVLKIAEGEESAGRHSFSIDTSELQAGVYFYRLSAGTASLVRAMIAVR